MDTRVLLGIIAATLMAVAVIVGGRAVWTAMQPEATPVPVAIDPTVDPGPPSEPRDGGAETRTGNADLDRAMTAARDTLTALSPDPARPGPTAPESAPESAPQPPDGPETASRPAADVEPPSVSPSVSRTPAAPRVEASGAPADPDAPTFDVVRVEPDGSAVIAGRATPGATVSILDGGASLGEVTADARGQWVFLPDVPLAAGDRELSLSARGGQAGTPGPAAPSLAEPGAERLSPTVVVLSVPKRDTAPNAQAEPAPVIALEAPRVGGGAGRLLQGPAPEVVQGTLQVSRVDYASSGALSLSGTAQPGTVLQLYMDNQPVARVQADTDGAWIARPDTKGLEEKLYTLRVDQVRPDGGVAQRLELPFQHTDFTFRRGDAGEVLLVVQPGNNLWRVARAVYGRGVDYTVIYQANTDQIRNPDLIYPGQVFVVPDEAPGPAGGTAPAPRGPLLPD